jgi:hypothetical protein
VDATPPVQACALKDPPAPDFKLALGALRLQRRRAGSWMLAGRRGFALCSTRHRGVPPMAGIWISVRVSNGPTTRRRRLWMTRWFWWDASVYTLPPSRSWWLLVGTRARRTRAD